MAALGYATVGSNQLDAAKSFYDALFATTDIVPLFEHPSGGRVYGKDGVIVFGVLGPFNGEPATVGNGVMIAFHFDTPSEAAAFHAKALELGATDEGPPAFRGGSPIFMSYFRDLDGNKLCAFHQAQRV
jgi:catechol 2,3-dioxygenase-like lactoylglutathione lyase family enzyme